MKRWNKYNGIKTKRIMQKLLHQLLDYSKIYWTTIARSEETQESNKAYWLMCKTKEIILHGINYENPNCILSNKTGNLISKQEANSQHLELEYEEILRRKEINNL